ncbi:10399_t:CDS:2, partial [Acaulospora colombiana]
HSRSSTPSSVTSPLAIAVPINATTPEAIDRAALLAAVEDSTQTIPTTMGPISTTGHARRLSIAQPILSPTVAVAPGPSHGRAASVAPSAAKAAPSSIKDFDIIKPISKGAFGSVFLAKKKTTGDYFAIKVLKKADMIAKNQITNVKAERMILMKQAESPFVVKLYFTFQSKDNLYLVMEYLNGGDCAALIKTLGSLPEEWARNYVAEVVLGLEFLHERGIVHRDLKPDNLLIDQHGHLKLTDFGLSRIGLLGRQTRESRRLPERLLGGSKANRNRRSPGSRPTSFDSGYLQSPLLSAKIEDTGSYFNPRMAVAAQLQDDVSESSGSEGVAHLMGRRGKLAHAESPLQSFASELTTELRSQHGQSGSNAAPHSGNTPPGPPEPKFVGTPDYLAPETILGLSEDDRCVDWWALGVITYEFLYGIPPFHAETPDKVFENILSMRIDWHEEWIEFSTEARNFMERLLIYDPSKRLGINGAKEVKAHPFFAEIEWDKVMQSEPQFVPQVTDPESTDYFDPRGAIPQLFQDDEPIAINRPPSENSTVNESPSKAQGTSAARGLLRDAVAAPAADDFGTFNFKNLPVLKQANDEVIKKLKSEQLAAVTHALGDAAAAHHRRRSISRRINKPTAVLTNFEPKLNQGEEARRNSMPSRLRTASVSSSDQDPSFSTAESWSQSVGTSMTSASPAPQEQKKAQDTDRAVVCLIAEDNPISAKILETLL